jgi:hypothetical protein
VGLRASACPLLSGRRVGVARCPYRTGRPGHPAEPLQAPGRGPCPRQPSTSGQGGDAARSYPPRLDWDRCWIRRRGRTACWSVLNVSSTSRAARFWMLGLLACGFPERVATYPGAASRVDMEPCDFSASGVHHCPALKGAQGHRGHCLRWYCSGNTSSTAWVASSWATQ